MNLAKYCTDNQMEYLLKEWDDRKNSDVSPKTVDACSHKKYWWKCTRGHEWQAEVKDRVTKKTDCPYCSGKKVLPGFNDLATMAPQIAMEWHPQKNGSLQPCNVTAGSDKKIWWRCSLGHEWQASVENRAVKKNTCPYCSGRKAWPGFNDLETLYPDIAGQWHPVRNKDLTPQAVRPGCAKKVWWICKEGHVWEARIYSRTSKKRPGCPFCAGNARKKHEKGETHAGV